jgi:hypothetical protein
MTARVVAGVGSQPNPKSGPPRELLLHCLPRELVSCKERQSCLSFPTVKFCTLITSLSYLCHLQHFRTRHHVCWLNSVVGSSERTNELQDSMGDSKSGATQRMASRMHRRLGHDFPLNLTTFRCCGTSSVPLAMFLLLGMDFTRTKGRFALEAVSSLLPVTNVVKRI